VTATIGLKSKFRNFRDNLKVNYTGEVLTREVNPAEIKYLQFPEWHVSKELKVTRGSTLKKSGDWSKVDHSRKVFWSSKYEECNLDQRNFIPIENFFFYQALLDRFLDGRSWEKTDWYRWIVKQLSNRPVLRYSSLEEIASRITLIEEMFEKMEIDGVTRESKKGFFEPPTIFSYPIVNISKSGRIAIEDGRHRICVAKIAKVDRIPVRIGVVEV
jgi:hypothetical protein